MSTVGYQFPEFGHAVPGYHEPRPSLREWQAVHYSSLVMTQDGMADLIDHIATVSEGHETELEQLLAELGIPLDPDGALPIAPLLKIADSPTDKRPAASRIYDILDQFAGDLAYELAVRSTRRI
ncbi:MAG TPA: hypothetical protein VLS27_00210 [Gammaproteobacteria bacterium]|nr:hypothetical protein [Gammaproteobacteria bacterium]